MIWVYSKHLTAYTTQYWASQVVLVVKNPPANEGDLQRRGFRSLDQEDPLEERMATHSNILAWRIPWIGEPVGLQVIGSKRAGHNWRDLAHTHASTAQYYRLPRWLSGKESAWQWRRYRKREFDPWIGKISWRRKWQPTSVLLEDPMDREAWWAITNGVSKSWTRLSTHAHRAQY